MEKRQPYFNASTTPSAKVSLQESPVLTAQAAILDSPPALEDSPGNNTASGEPGTPRKDRKVSWVPMTPPVTPPRPPKRGGETPPRAAKASPLRAPYCTPPRSPARSRTVHNPYKMMTPPARSPMARTPLTRSSPKPRTPTRTRLELEHRNSSLKSPSQLSLSLSPLMQNLGLSTSLHGTPLQVPCTPNASCSLQQPQTPSIATPTAAGLFTPQDHLPPSLQPTPQHQITQTNLSAQFNQLQAACDNPLQVLAQLPYLYPLSPPQLAMAAAAATYSPQVAVPYAYLASLGQFAALPYAQLTAFPLTTAATLSPTPAMTTPSSPMTTSMTTTTSVATTATGSATDLEGTPQSKAASSDSTGPTRVYVLGEFKRGRTVQFQSTYMPQPGEYFICEGDEGEDLGMCVHAWVGPTSAPPVVNNSLAANRNSNGRHIDPMTGDPAYPRVLRPATPKEVHILHNVQAQAEIKCTETAKHRVLEHGLDMKVIDAEYQFDRKKLTFYYDSGDRVDFRDLIRDLYKLYRARIWMSKVRHQDQYQERSKTGSSFR